jgi:glycosyltransferase involved in cell wall biosynthesis
MIRNGKQKVLSIIVPAYNEEKTIISVLEKVFGIRSLMFSKSDIVLEVIVVDDGSSDKTQSLITDYKQKHADLGIKSLMKPNGGKGSAVRLGLSKASGDFIIIQDADLEYDPADYPSLLAPIIDGRADAVYGSRFLDKPFFSKSCWAIPLHFIGNKILSITTSILYGKLISDMETGYKCFKKGCLKNINLESNDFTIEAEITAKLLRQKLRILEVPISYKSRSFAQGKKITWHDGIRALLALLKYYF